MKHILFGEPATSYPIAILCKSTSFSKQEILTNYVTPLNLQGISIAKCIAFNLVSNENDKTPVKFIKDYLSKLLLALDSIAVKAKYLYVADSAYFKVLTGKPKADPYIGYVLPCTIKGYEHMQVILGINYSALIYNPDLQHKLDRTLTALLSSIDGTYIDPGIGIIHSSYYPESLQDIAQALKKLHSYPNLTCDIETRSLHFYEAGLETIAFAWDKHNGAAFCVDKNTTLEEAKEIKKLLKEFFITYRGKLIYHNASFDLQILIYELFMKELV